MTTLYSMAPLNDAAKLLSGGTPRKSNPEYWGGSIPWLTPKDMANWQGATENSITEKAIGNGTRLAPIQTSFIAVRGMSLHNEIRVIHSETRLAFNQDIKAVVAADGVLPKFLYYALVAAKPQLLEWVSAAGHGTGVMETDRLLSVPVPRLGTDQQAEIASVLSALDDKIELNRRMNETLEALAQAIFKDWFVTFGPTRRKLEGASDPVAILGGLIPDPAKAAPLAALFPDTFGDDGLPEGWEETSIYDFASITYGAPFASSQFNSERRGRPLIRIRDLPNHGSDFFTDEVHKKEFVIQPGTIVVGMDGEFRARVWQGLPSLMNQRVCAFLPIESKDRAFTYFSIIPQLRAHELSAIGTTVIHLGKKELDTFTAIQPGGALVDAFSEIAEPMLERCVSNGLENRTLAETRDYLLPKLMSGAVRVRDVEAMAE